MAEGSAKKKREPGSSYLIIDSEGVIKPAFTEAKKSRGATRQIAVETQGLIRALQVHAANDAANVEGRALAYLAMEIAPTAGLRRSDEDTAELPWITWSRK